MEKVNWRDLSNLPNLITLSRIALFFPLWMIISSGNFWLALLIYLWGPISDILDGEIARRYNKVTVIGKALDPLADKVFYLATPFILGIPEEFMSFWFLLLGLEIALILLGFAAFLTIMANEKVESLKMELGANQYGKLKAITEILFTTALFISKFEPGPDLLIIMDLSLFSAVFMAIMSIVGHLKIADLLSVVKL